MKRDLPLWGSYMLITMQQLMLTLYVNFSLRSFYAEWKQQVCFFSNTCVCIPAVMKKLFLYTICPTNVTPWKIQVMPWKLLANHLSTACVRQLSLLFCRNVHMHTASKPFPNFSHLQHSLQAVNYASSCIGGCVSYSEHLYIHVQIFHNLCCVRSLALLDCSWPLSTDLLRDCGVNIHNKLLHSHVTQPLLLSHHCTNATWFLPL